MDLLHQQFFILQHQQGVIQKNTIHHTFANRSQFVIEKESHENTFFRSEPLKGALIFARTVSKDERHWLCREMRGSLRDSHGYF
jgi:hypothetical protein